MFKVRVILDTEEDVIRTIKVSEKYNLEQLHEFIAKCFGVSGLEMASFYRTDDEWNQGEEIPLFDMSDSNTGITMKNYELDSILTTAGSKLIYIYDFMNMWAFYVELVEIDTDAEASAPQVILSVGEPPQKAPDKQFVSDEEDNLGGDHVDDAFEDFDDYNDFYSDEYNL